jgi:hypothetical protein
VNYDTAPGWVYQGQSNAKFSGKLSRDAVAVGLSVPNVTSGYWLRPAGLPDPQTQELTWDASLDVSDDVTPGYHDVAFVAIDGNGHAGDQLVYRLCVRSRVPDNFNACDPTSDAPEAVISLKWDANVDLDLQVVDPHGNLIDGKHPATKPVGAAVASDAGVMDRDSNAGCFLDGVRFENLVWNKAAPSGRYGIYVNLFDACKQPTVHFEVSVYSAEAVKGAKAAAGRILKRYYAQSGVLMDYQVNSGEGRGLFITEFDFK